MRASLVVTCAALVVAGGCQRSGPPASRAGAGARPAPADTAARAHGSTDDAAGVLRAYYRAIQERRYDDAYRLWARAWRIGSAKIRPDRP